MRVLTCTALLRKQLFWPGIFSSPLVFVMDMLFLGFSNWAYWRNPPVALPPTVGHFPWGVRGSPGEAPGIMPTECGFHNIFDYISTENIKIN